ncbi:hypothetical protein OKW34_003807 [Paraburkholderia youngii]|uniref:hypothetical protein n=1 Tax=Paraburkholderia youngii TaxID=2782701 RepID=UPI003D199EC3
MSVMNALEVEGTVRMCIVALIDDYASSMRATRLRNHLRFADRMGERLVTVTDG